MTIKNEDTEKTVAVYPYGPISTCLPIAEAVKALGGGNSPVSKASLASYLKEDERSAGLMTKIASAKAFGMIEGRSNFKLTEPATRFFSSTGQAHRSALIDFLESPLAFKKLVQRFDGTVLPPVEALAMMLHNDTEVPKSWQERVAGFFLRSAKSVGAIDDMGHLRIKALKEMRSEGRVPEEAGIQFGAQIKAPTVGPPQSEAPSGSTDPTAKLIRGINSAPRSFSLNETDGNTGEKRLVYAEVPADLSLSMWKILAQWVESIKPKEPAQ